LAYRTQLLGIGIVAALTAAPGGLAQTATSVQECAALWNAADANKDGSLTGQELERFKAIIAKIDTDKDGKISEAEFMAACQKGDLKNIGQ
jgi:Ca2+-binding EF-hand superfamily protein